MTIDTKKMRESADRFAKDDANEDLDAQEWGEAMPPWDVIALLDELDEAKRLVGTWQAHSVEAAERRSEALGQVARLEQLLAEKDSEIERLRLRTTELEASMDAAQAAITAECVEHVELNGHIDIARQCHDWIDHEIMDEGDPTGRLGEFAASLSVVVEQFDKQRRRANWHEAGYKAGKEKLIEHAVDKALDAARAAARALISHVDNLGAFADDNDPRVMATAEPISAAQADLWQALGLDHDQEAARLRADIDSRCAVCGWPLADSIDKGCVRGNCSYRPRPERLYAPARAEREAKS